MTPLAYYQQQLANGKIQEDEAQLEIIQAIDSLYLQLMARQRLLPRIVYSTLHCLGFKTAPIRGLYVYGGVGRGKTFMMDILFNLYPSTKKTRMHFHHFMQFVHQSLHQYEGHKNPLKLIAKQCRQRFTLLCFDEFYVTDIADAMCLAELLKHLFEEGVTLVATSNLAPKELYRNGLQRDKFLPAIALIEQHTQVMQLKGQQDWRLQQLSMVQLYHYPLTQDVHALMAKSFELLAGHPGKTNQKIRVNDRWLQVKQINEQVIWFEFAELCATNRSAIDYIEIARTFHTLFLSQVLIMTEQHEDIARRFIALIDECYERHVTVIISAQASWQHLYQGQRYRFEFERTISRITEMQSQTYLALPHLS